ncbi:PcfJ domain-containing protein [Pararhizobium sp. BT-229]|uniref:PcfJ domain-containing protein n=1 Tax=Pararhizobium sp. BT-229 TaxID=2986923 RepID=UPI0021F70FE4|nr:PcfJ domain-containing protein [Pararhizobium sp. BT-229]MCV9964150.1 PcfJ domain-containing protein [Pararhizobium sp. BT-229]
MYGRERREADTKSWLSDWSGGDGRIAELLWHSVGRIRLASDEDMMALDMASEMDRRKMVGHIADWLKVAVADNAPWLGRLDKFGRPKKLMKFASLDAISAEADKQMRRKQASLGKSSGVLSGEEEFHYDLGGGWSLVKLLSKASLDWESEAMQHCIGHGSYDGHLQRDDALLLSLRDPYGKPHATIEIVNGELIQFQGKQNVAPVEKYVVKCLPYFSGRRIRCHDSSLVTDVQGFVYSVYDLPKTLEVAGDVYLSNRSGRPLRLPREIRCGGHLHILGHAFGNVPEHVSCSDFYVTDKALADLPVSMDVSGGINLNGSSISVLPDGLWVRGDLKLQGTPITTLPVGLHVDGVLSVSDTKLVELPGDLRTGGIAMRNTAIKRLDTAWIGGGEDGAKNLVARDSALEEIVGTPVFYHLDIAGTRIATLSAGMKVHDLDISRSPVRVIPPDIVIAGKLTAFGCPDLTIDVTRVGGDVTLKKSRVRMPETFECGGTLEFAGDFEGLVPKRVKAHELRYSCARGNFPDFVEAIAIDISGSPLKRLEGTVTTHELRVSHLIEFLGSGVSAELVGVGHMLFGMRMSLDEAREAISKHGNLERTHRGELTIPAFQAFGMTGGGKSTLLFDIREFGERFNTQD